MVKFSEEGLRLFRKENDEEDFFYNIESASLFFWITGHYRDVYDFTNDTGCGRKIFVHFLRKRIPDYVRRSRDV